MVIYDKLLEIAILCKSADSRFGLEKLLAEADVLSKAAAISSHEELTVIASSIYHTVESIYTTTYLNKGN